MGGGGGGVGRGAAKSSTYNLHSLFSFVKYVSSTKKHQVQYLVYEDSNQNHHATKRTNINFKDYSNKRKFVYLLTFDGVELESLLFDGHASAHSFLRLCGVVIATIATDKLTRTIYKQKKPKKVHIDTTTN
jgi:hypothetical protein